MFEDMNKAIVKYSIKPVIDKVYDFENAKDAFLEMQNAGHFGKLVVRV